MFDLQIGPAKLTNPTSYPLTPVSEAGPSSRVGERRGSMSSVGSGSGSGSRSRSGSENDGEDGNASGGRSEVSVEGKGDEEIAREGVERVLADGDNTNSVATAKRKWNSEVAEPPNNDSPAPQLRPSGPRDTHPPRSTAADFYLAPKETPPARPTLSTPQPGPTSHSTIPTPTQALRPDLTPPPSLDPAEIAKRADDIISRLTAQTTSTSPTPAEGDVRQKADDIIARLEAQAKAQELINRVEHFHPPPPPYPYPPYPYPMMPWMYPYPPPPPPPLGMSSRPPYGTIPPRMMRPPPPNVGLGMGYPPPPPPGMSPLPLPGWRPPIPIGTPLTPSQPSPGSLPAASPGPTPKLELGAESSRPGTVVKTESGAGPSRVNGYNRPPPPGLPPPPGTNGYNHPPRPASTSTPILESSKAALSSKPYAPPPTVTTPNPKSTIPSSVHHSDSQTQAKAPISPNTKDARTIFLAPLPPSTTIASLRAAFEPLSPITTIELRLPYAMIEFDKDGAAEKAVERYDEGSFGGEVIRVERAISGSAAGGGSGRKRSGEGLEGGSKRAR